MPVSEAFRVAKGGFTTLAGEVDHVARAGVAALRRELGSLTTRVTAVEDGATKQTFVPAWSNLTVGTGATEVYEYTQIGDRLDGHFLVVLGTGPAVSGDVSFTLPVASSRRGIIGTVQLVDTGTATFAGPITVNIDASATAVVRSYNAAGTTLGGGSPLSSTSPHTWVATDVLAGKFSYLT